MREVMGKVGEGLGRYICVCNYYSGPCMLEITAIGTLEGLDVVLNDALYGILFRDTNTQCTLVDQSSSRAINAYAGVAINTGKNDYLIVADVVEGVHTVLASQFLNKAFALQADLLEEQQGLGHALETDPGAENSFLHELAQTEMTCEIPPKIPSKYVPPTRLMTGDILRGWVQDALFSMVTILTDQKIHLLGMTTEIIHTPSLSDRFLTIQNAQHIFRTIHDLDSEIVFKDDGIVQNRATDVLKKATDLLTQVERLDIFKALERGILADIKCSRDGDKGLDGVVSKVIGHFNPFLAPMMKRGAGK